jgi:hypothetical protein
MVLHLKPAGAAKLFPEDSSSIFGQTLFSGVEAWSEENEEVHIQNIQLKKLELIDTLRKYCGSCLLGISDPSGAIATRHRMWRYNA